MTDARPDPLNGARWDVRHGDALDVLRGLPDGSISAVVTDPPYGLSSHDRHVPAILRAWLDGSDAADVAARLRGFMGREWDALPPSPVVWREVLRVLKPGGHCLAFGGTRTSHLVAIGLQLAGFEIRDAIEASGLASAAHLLWCFGSGFPKGHNVSKAIDKEAGAVREVFGSRSTNRNRPITDARDSSAQDKASVAFGTGEGMIVPLTAPATPEAAQWEGWDVALSPSQEPVIVARKPLGGLTVAECVTTWGTGGLNIDGCRVPSGGTHGSAASAGKGAGRGTYNGTAMGKSVGGIISAPHALGRWPANLVLVHATACTPGACVPGCAVRAIGEQSGERVATLTGRADPTQTHANPATAHPPAWFGTRTNGNGGAVYADSGTAARFFPQARYADADAWPFRYCPKASRAERERGCERLPARTGAEAVDREAGSAGMDSPRAGAGRTAERVRNFHPTVKPVEIMRWLCRLVTPPGGIVADFFCGSGTTGCGALAEGFRFLGVERDAGYVEIARARLRSTAARPLGWRYRAETATQADLFAPKETR